MSEENFMKRGLSPSETPGDFQHVLNDGCDLESGAEITFDLEPWDKLLTKLTSLFI